MEITKAEITTTVTRCPECDGIVILGACIRCGLGKREGNHLIDVVRSLAPSKMVEITIHVGKGSA